MIKLDGPPTPTVLGSFPYIFLSSPTHVPRVNRRRHNNSDSNSSSSSSLVQTF